VTDENGIYGFTGLMPGKYYVVFLTTGFTIQDAGGDTVDSDADPTTGETICTTLDSGETDLTWDAGIVPLTTYILGIHIEKATNAADPMNPTSAEDADGPTGPIVPVPSTVTWTYLVTNTGDVALTNVVVTDDSGTPTDISDGFNPAFVGGDTDGDDELDVGEVWLYEATGPAAVGNYENWAVVEGTGPDDETVTDDDPSHYFGAKPAIDIEKATNGEDADEETGPIVQVGSTVTWTYVITNTGNVPLSNCKVVDDNGTPGATTDDETIADGFSLDVGESQEFTATGIAVAGQYMNWAATRGEDQFGEEVTDKDPSHYFAEEEQPPEITIVKSGEKVCEPDGGCDCTYTQGYWKNHPEAWPVDSLTIGGTTYDKDQLLAILNTPPKSDARIILLHQLIAAMLNVANEADPTEAEDAIAEANDWLASHPEATPTAAPAKGKKTKAAKTQISDEDRQVAITLADVLDAYNNGDIGPGHCDDGECDDGDGEPCDPSVIKIGDTIEYTITVTANLPEARQAIVVDRLDSGLQFPSADNGGTYVPADHVVVWEFDLDPGQSTTTLKLRVKIVAEPHGDGICDGPGWIHSNIVELPVIVLDCEPGEPGEGCTYTIGYWKNHPEAWPEFVELNLGTDDGPVLLTKDEALDLLKKPVKGDKSIILAHQLIGAKLNILNGADDSAVADAVEAAEEWFAEHGLAKVEDGPSASIAVDLADILDDYNNGVIGPGHCDDKECDDGDCDDDDDCEPTIVPLKNRACIRLLVD